MKFTQITCIFLLLFPSISHATNQQLPVLVTLPPLAGLVLTLSPNVNIQCLLPNNADPHHFQLTPRQINSLHHATLLVRSPRDDQSWAMLQSATPTFHLWEKHEGKKSHDPIHVNKHDHTDTHAWLNPKLVALALPHLAEALIQSNPANEQGIQTQLKRSQQQAQNTWQQWQVMVKKKQLKQRGVMMQHPSWRSLFEALGVPIRGVLESSQHGQEYGPRKLEKALQVLQDYPQTLLIADSNHSNRALTWLQKHSSNTMVQLDALGLCAEPWQNLMRRNLKTLSTLGAIP